MSKKTEAKCPCCGGRVKHFPDQENHDGMSIAVKQEMLSALKVDLELLKQQAAILGKVVDKGPLTDDERFCLEGLWEFVHRIIDCMEPAAHVGGTE